MVSIKVTPEEIEKLKLVAKAYNEGGKEAAKEKIKELKIKVEAPTIGTSMGESECVPCVSCPTPGNPAFIIAYGYLA